MTIDQMLARGRARRQLQQQPSELARIVRRQAGLTQGEMATVLDVDRSAISRWETGARTPRAAVLTKYVELLDRLAAKGA